MNAPSLLGIFLRGMCMGAADLVPGVSGGTIAFISGIYQRLLAALAAFSAPALWRALARAQLRHCWRLADGAFLLALLAGILCAIVLLSGLLHSGLQTHPHWLFGFFFGLVVASIIAIARRLPSPAVLHVLLAAAAAAATFYLTTANVLAAPSATPLALFGGGMVAISAMLLPGISGSYILLILGLYPEIIAALHERDWPPLLIFAAGCAAGLLLFARLLARLLEKFHRATIAALLGVMVGALPTLWPWKAAGGDTVLQSNVMPAQFAAAPDVGAVATLALAGCAAALLLSKAARQKNGG